MGSPRITYVAHPNATPETELSRLVAVYKFLLDCRAKKEAATSRVSRPQDAERRSSDGARDIIQDTK